MNPKPPVATVDAQNPWLGLVSFTEETRGYFHGREEESAELCRRVQRKLLTVLFGQSGLGKTSILQAGLVPRLRPEGFCPVYVRLDYSPYAPSPSDQIKRMLFQATETAGSWTKSGSAVEGESLWEFLHHRDDVLKDPTGRTLTPILIFDQFEEIFTLAQTDDTGRRRAQEFLADLADLVENRPPAALEARIDRDEADAAKFDFARADYRVLISLREDYLAHLEGLKDRMPSITQNRMRLARMTGPQAVAAVCAPAPHLVSEAVAAAIVRFVSGASDLATAEVEPSLLSLICRELNNTRLAGGHAEISADLLAGSRDSILKEFYERALADQPHGVRIFVEDEMLTESGFRESVAEERVRKGFAAAGASPEALATLVNRRLLRVEDRLDLRRVEITHDVLCSVIASSRGVRHEHEALEESRRQLALQREREAATRKALVRARLVAAVCAVLMVAAAGSAVFGWINLRRARQAEQKTLAAQRLTEKARSEAEKLVGFLLEDFYEELEPTGRVEIVGELADKAVAYYDSLPLELVTAQTRLYHGMALIRKAGALSVHDPVASTKVCAEAQAIFEQLRREGDMSEATTLGLALAFETKNGSAIISRNSDELQKAVDLLRPFVNAGTASRSTRLALADTLQFLALESTTEKGIPLCEESRKVLLGAGALELNDLTASSIYGDVCDTESRLYLHVGNLDGAADLAGQVGRIAEKVLALRPGDLRAMKDRMQSPNVLGMVEEAREHLDKAEAYQSKSEEASRSYTLFNPTDSYGWEFLSGVSNRLADLKEREGRVGEALAQWHKTADLDADPQNVTSSAGNSYDAWRGIALFSAELGRLDDTRKALAKLHGIGQNFMKIQGTDESFAQVSSVWEDIYQFDILAANGDYQTIHERAIALDERLKKITPQSSLARTIRIQGLRETENWVAESALRTGRAEEAASVAKELSEHLRVSPFDEKHAMDLEQAKAHVRYGEALLNTDHAAEARVQIEQALGYFRDRLAKGATDTPFRQNYARALFQMSRTEGNDEASSARRRALLDEAANILGGLSQEAQLMKTSKELIENVTRARGFAGT